MNVPPAFHYDGPNARLVNEVIEFAFGDRVFSASGPDERRESVLLILDVHRAVYADGGQEPENYFPVERAAMQAQMNSTNLSDDDLQFNWQDLRSNQIAKLIWTTHARRLDRILPTHAVPSAALHKTFGHLRTCLRAFG